jgi:iron-sulfur cluster insertion protein
MTTESPLHFTRTAAEKVKNILQSMAEEETDAAEKEKVLAQNLRISITGGGCSGFKYEFAFDERDEEEDIAVTQDGVTLIVDPISFGYLSGATVDYEENAEGEQFIIRNPNANSQCGCGQSFSA